MFIHIIPNTTPTHPIDWVIVGGESDPKARSIKKRWIESIKKECGRTETPFFFKQSGKKDFNENPNDPTINTEHKNHAKGGCQIEGLIFRAMPSNITLKEKKKPSPNFVIEGAF